MSILFLIFKYNKNSEKEIMRAPFISYDPPTEPIGVMGDLIFIKIGTELYWTEDGEPETDVLIAMSREDYIENIKMWLDAKKDYCERYNHFCGQDGSIHAETFEKKILEEHEDKHEYYLCSNFDEPDMEHG